MAILSAICGAVVAGIVAFGAGWIVSTGTLRESVADAEVQLLSAFCADEAKESWHGRVPEELDGWGYLDRRRGLASKFVPILPGTEAVRERAILECAELIADLASG